MSLALRKIVFTLVVPGAGAVYAPWWILTRSGATPEPVAWPAIVFIVAGAALYVACLWVVASVGRGTPGPWDPPRQFVAVGPYRWVRNPIYIAALLVMVGEAWLFLSLPLVLYAVAAASVVARRAMRISPRHEQRSPSRLSPSVVATAATEPANDSCVVLARGPRHGFRTKVLRSGRAASPAPLRPGAPRTTRRCRYVTLGLRRASTPAPRPARRRRCYGPPGAL